MASILLRRTQPASSHLDFRIALIRYSIISTFSNKKPAEKPPTCWVIYQLHILPCCLSPILWLEGVLNCTISSQPFRPSVECIIKLAAAIAGLSLAGNLLCSTKPYRNRSVRSYLKASGACQVKNTPKVAVQPLLFLVYMQSFLSNLNPRWKSHPQAVLSPWHSPVVPCRTKSLSFPSIAW